MSDYKRKVFDVFPLVISEEVEKSKYTWYLTALQDKVRRKKLRLIYESLRKEDRVDVRWGIHGPRMFSDVKGEPSVIEMLECTNG